MKLIRTAYVPFCFWYLNTIRTTICKMLQYFSLAMKTFFSKNTQLTFQFHDIGYRGLYLCCGDVLTTPPTA